jgi:hypothetical protein
VIAAELCQEALDQLLQLPAAQLAVFRWPVASLQLLTPAAAAQQTGRAGLDATVYVVAAQLHDESLLPSGGCVACITRSQTLYIIEALDNRSTGG